MSTYGPSLPYIMLQLNKLGFSVEETKRTIELLQESDLSDSEHLLNIYYQITTGQKTKEEILRDLEKRYGGKLSADAKFLVWAHQLMVLGFTPNEAERVLRWAVAQAKTTPYSALDHVVAVIGDILDGRLSKEEVLRNMEHILVITPRELKDIVFCMDYSLNYNHGADGHNRMNTVTKLAEHLGFYWNEGAKSVEIPRSVHVEEPATTGRAGGV